MLSCRLSLLAVRIPFMFFICVKGLIFPFSTWSSCLFFPTVGTFTWPFKKKKNPYSVSGDSSCCIKFQKPPNGEMHLGSWIFNILLVCITWWASETGRPAPITCIIFGVHIYQKGCYTLTGLHRCWTGERKIVPHFVHQIHQTRDQT